MSIELESRKWHKELKRQDLLEAEMDEKRLNEKEEK